MKDEQITELMCEIIEEQHISNVENESTLKNMIKSAMYDINEFCGTKINYEIDLKAKELLKNYVLYARYQRLAEFKKLYEGEYVYLQAKYYKPSNI